MTSRPGRTPIPSAQPRIDARHDEVEQRLDDQRRAERGVGRAPDAVVDEIELEDVSRPGGDDRVHADAGEVGAPDRPAGNGQVGIGGADDVPPRRHAGQQPEQVEPERDRERQPVDVREVVEERPRGVDDLPHGDGG